MEGPAPPLVAWLDTLSDLARLRILRLLDHEELSVGELARALQLPQSTVSRHLKVLADGGWIRKRVEGTASFYRMVPQALDAGAARIWETVRTQLGTTPTFAEDDHRLREVIAERTTDSRSFFGRVGGEWDRMRRELFGQAFSSEALLGLVRSDWVVADLGCGTGDAAELLAPLVRQVIAVDREPAMLSAARKRLSGYTNIEFREGDLLELPIDDTSVDVTVVILVIHHLEQPAQAVREMARILRPRGRALIVDMVHHDRDVYQDTMGHRHLGFDEDEVGRWAADAGLVLRRYRRLRVDTHAKGPGLFMAVLEKARGLEKA